MEEVQMTTKIIGFLKLDPNWREVRFGLVFLCLVGIEFLVFKFGQPNDQFWTSIACYLVFFVYLGLLNKAQWIKIYLVILFWGMIIGTPIGYLLFIKASLSLVTAISAGIAGSWVLFAILFALGNIDQSS